MVITSAFRLQITIFFSLLVFGTAFIPFYGIENYDSTYQPVNAPGPFRRLGPVSFSAYRPPEIGRGPKAASKRNDHRGINGHMLKQPLLKFDVLWRKFGGNKRFEP